MGTTWNRRATKAGRIAILLMVIGVAACDNVEWGGMDVAVVPPPAKASPMAGDIEAGDELPQGPILYHVVHDSAHTRIVPVGEIVDEELRPIATGGTDGDFGDRFTTTFFRRGAEFTLFHNGRRAGTMVVESAQVPTGNVCRALPRATGRVELSAGVSEATEFLAMARTQAPEGRMIPGGEIQVERRMQAVANILAERTLRARGAQLPNWSRARRQLQPIPVSGSQDLGFTATYLSDDELAVGNDDEGYSLFIVYTPQAQTGYDTAYVKYTSYTAQGKAAPRTIDFLDWDRDGSAELLLEVFGTTNSWYAAVGEEDGEWSQFFEDRCDERAATAPADTAAADTASADTASPARPAAGQRQRPAGASRPPAQSRPSPARPDTTPRTTRADPFPDVQPRVRLALPSARPTERPDTAPEPRGLRPR